MEDWPLIGRDAELASVIEWLSRDPPGGVVIGGPAGVGKSRLLREVADQAEQHGWPTRTVIGTRTGASIPFGALASFLTDGPDTRSAVEMLAHVRRTLESDGSRPLLIVDDAQRLDAASATLVNQMVTEGVCRMVATVRTGEPAPDAIESLWTGGWAMRIDLAGLSQAETDELLVRALHGPVDGATSRHFWQSSRGN